MNFSLLPNPEIVKIPEKLTEALAKLKEKLEKKEHIDYDRMVISKHKDRICCQESRTFEEDSRIDHDIIPTYIKPQKMEKSFKELLFETIDKKGLADSDVYNKALIDRRLFSKIRTGDDYHPSKGTVLQLCLALELSIKETLTLLKSADYYLTKNSEENLIMHYIIENKIYNVVEANNILYSACGKTIDQL